MYQYRDVLHFNIYVQKKRSLSYQNTFKSANPEMNENSLFNSNYTLLLINYVILHFYFFELFKNLKKKKKPPFYLI